jgi:SP family xylose:H+ symportor-like MFS transporter
MMQPDVVAQSIAQQSPDLRLNAVYIWAISSIAALGGLLFGYDWVVIGGAKPFYEVYFHLTTARAVGWANSCALVGCLAGSMVAGGLSDRFGRKKLLATSALLFALSSIFTGWAHLFATFVVWRMLGGVAIGLSSNVSPTYIAEISPAQWRGRLVSLNQLALVTGILAAQLVNWRVAAHAGTEWAVHYGWRWMFTAVALPGAVLLFASMLIPESPRWLAAKGHQQRARTVLEHIGGDDYAQQELTNINQSLRANTPVAIHWRELFIPGMRRVMVIGITLAVLQQWSGINVLFNYAEEVYRSAGYNVSGILFNIVITGAINLFFTIIAMGCVDRFGRRPLMLLGCGGICASHLLAAAAYWKALHGTAVLVITLLAIACYAVSLAPVTWVVITEIFPNRMRGLAVSVAVSALWAAAFLLTYTFPLILQALGIAGAFFLYALICLSGGVFVLKYLPETKGRSLEEVEEAMSAT